MDLWLEQQLNDLESNQSSEQYFSHLTTVAKSLGFDFCSFGIRRPYPVSSPRIELLSNYPEEWLLRYHRQNYFEIDPTVIHGSRSSLPMIWSDEVFVDTPELWEDARSHGIEHGWAQSTFSFNGTTGMLILARSDEHISENELRKHRYHLLWLTQLTHQVLTDLITQEQRLIPQLSLREKEVLKWSADGKTAEDVAAILNITKRTVNFHIGRAISKLQVANKTAATVKAAMMGLL